MFLIKNPFVSIFLCFILILSACTMPTATPTEEPILGEPIRVIDYYVATTGNDSNDCLSTATACLTMYSVLRKSTPQGIIHVGPGEFRRESGGALWAGHDLTIIGAGVDRTFLTIHSSVVIQLTTSARVEIRDLTIDGPGYSLDAITSSKGIEIRAGQLILQNCRIRNQYNGLDVWREVSVSVNNCSFEDNYYALSNSGNLTLIDSNFTRNLLGLSNGGMATVENTSFDRNGASDASSGASTTAVTNNGMGTLTMRGGNISNTNGYGLIVDGGTVALEGVTVDNNVGMAIWHQQGTLSILSSIIRDNRVYGVIVGGRSGVASIGRVNISQTAIVRNGYSGLRIDGGEIHVQNTTISGNNSSGLSEGGGIGGYGGNLFLLDSTVGYNNGTGITLGRNDAGAAVITARRSVVALNSGSECQLDPSTVLSVSTFARFVCDDSWTRATLKLRPLTNEAGTFVHPIDADSPLVNAGGVASTCPSVDQRAYPRPSGSTCDVGAYEFGSGSASAPIVIATAGTPEIIALPTPTETPASLPFILTVLVPSNCRKGPGTVYEVVTSVLQGQQVPIIGKNAENTWWYGDFTNYKCWIFNGAGTPSGDLSLLPILIAPPTPVPTAQPQGPIDFDQDGFNANVDCNDKNPLVYPGAPEIPQDNIDSNCNGNNDQ